MFKTLLELIILRNGMVVHFMENIYFIWCALCNIGFIVYNRVKKMLVDEILVSGAV